MSSWFYLVLSFLPILLLSKKLIGKRSKNLQLPPSPPKLPILGNLHQLDALAHQSLWKISKKYGEVMLLQLGRVHTIIISSAEAATEALKVHDLDCCTRAPLITLGKLSYNYSDISFSPYGDYWRNMRKLCVVEFFSMRKAQSYRFIREEEVASMISSISQLSSSGSAVNLTEKLFFLTGSIVFRMAFGKAFQESDVCNERFGEIVREAIEVLGSFSASEYFPILGWIVDWLSGFHGKFERSFNELDGFFQQVIDDHLNPDRINQDHQEDIVDVLLRIESEGTQFGERPLNKDSIKAVIMDLFLAGVDTSAATVNWAMAELVRKPQLMKKAQHEVRKLIGKRGRVTEDEINHLQYLKMIVKETLRLHPPAPLLLPRETISHFRINGYDVCPKTLIQVNVWAIGRDPKYWKNPEEFFPERFEGKSIDFRGQDFEFLPFGAGRRVCPGINLATKTIELALANLLYRFDWKLPFGMEKKNLNMEEGPGLTISKKAALHLLAIIDSFTDN